MPKMSWCIVVYGALLVFSDVLDASTGLNAHLDSATLIPCWSGGLLIIAAGIASAQGRRSLRTTGIWMGTLLPLALAALFAWQALRLWRTPQQTHAIAFTIITAASLACILLVNYLRPREGISTRGYAVHIAKPAAAVRADAAKSTPATRSEAG